MSRARFVALVQSFPVLARYAPGVYAGDIDLALLDAWAAHDPEAVERVIGQGKSPFPGDGAKNAARFILHLWDSKRAWACGPFDLFAALVSWDPDQVRAFQRWAAAPWRP